VLCHAACEFLSVLKVDTEWLSFGREKPVWSKILSEHLPSVALPDDNYFLWEWFVENFGKYESFIDRDHKFPYLRAVGSFSRAWPIQVSGSKCVRKLRRMHRFGWYEEHS